MTIQPLAEGCYFHIYNRGVNGEDIFKEEKNYHYFLQQYNKYCSVVFETMAYALLKNHFHLLVFVKENVIVPKYNGKGSIQLNASKQLGHFFNSYAQSINKMYHRTGSLFESPFERKNIEDSHYITAVILYCHFNPQLHGFVDNFKDWPFTSYHSILKNEHPFLATQKTIDWFGGITAYEKVHLIKYNDEILNQFKLE